LPRFGIDVGHHSAGKVFQEENRACFCTKREWASKRKPVAMHVLDPDASLFEDGWVTAPKKNLSGVRGRRYGLQMKMLRGMSALAMVKGQCTSRPTAKVRVLSQFGVDKLGMPPTCLASPPTPSAATPSPPCAARCSARQASTRPCTRVRRRGPQNFRAPSARGVFCVGMCGGCGANSVYSQ